MKLAILVLASVAAFAQTKPPANPPQQKVQPQQKPEVAPPPEDIVKLKPAEENDVLKIQRDLSNAEVQAFQAKDRLEELNQQSQKFGQTLNEKLQSLRKEYNLPPDTYFNHDKLYFVKQPEKK